MLKHFWNRCVRRCLNFTSWGYHGWTLRIKKVIRSLSNRSMRSNFWRSWNFPKYWRWWGVQASKFTKFARWRDFNALRRAHVSFTWLVEWLHPKSNIVYRGDCLTKGGRTIRALSNFDHYFRDRNDVFWKSLQFVWSARAWISFSQSITAGRCEARKLYVAKQPVPWGRIFENHEFFQNIDAGEWFRLLKSRNSFAGAISMLCGAPTYIFMWFVKWLHP